MVNHLSAEEPAQEFFEQTSSERWPAPACSLTASAVDLRHLLRTLDEAATIEQRQFARDLHDDLGQTLAAAQIRLALLCDDPGEDVQERCAEVAWQPSLDATTTVPSRLPSIDSAPLRLLNVLQRF